MAVTGAVVVARTYDEVRVEEPGIGATAATGRQWLEWRERALAVKEAEERVVETLERPDGEQLAEVMLAIGRALQPLPREARQRVVRAVMFLYDVEA